MSEVFDVTNLKWRGEEVTPIPQEEQPRFQTLADEVHKFYVDGMAQFEHIAFGQTEAKKAILAGFLMGTTKNMEPGTRRIGVIELAGTYGIGKTALNKEIHRLVKGFTRADVARIEADAELEPMSIGGGEIVDIVKKSNSEGILSEEETIHVIRGIIRAHHKIIRVPEKSRINYAAMPFLFDVAEEGIIQTSHGPVELTDTVLMLTDFNSEDRKTVQVLSAANQSRSDALVVLHDADDKLTYEQRRDLRNDNTPDPSLVEHIVDPETLSRWQSLIDELDLPDDVDLYADRLISKAKELFKIDKYDIKEGYRIHRQVGRLTKIFALFDKKAEATTDHVDKAIKLVAGTRLGGLSEMYLDDNDLGELIDTYTDELLEAA